MILLLLFIIIVLFLTGSWIYLLRDAKRCNLPGPAPYPVIGNGNLFLVDSSRMLEVLSEISIKYGDACRVHIMSERYILLSHPKYIEQFLSSSETITKGTSYNFLHPWLGDGLLTSTGNKWKSHRKLLTPAFHYNILQSYLPIFTKNEKILCKQLEGLANGSPIELFPIIALAALDNITESIMGVSYQTQKDRESKYVTAIAMVSEIMSTRMRNFLMANEILFSLTPQKKTQEKSLEYLHGRTNEVITTRRQELKKTNTNHINATSEIGMKNQHAFLDLLLLAEVDGKTINDQSVKDEVETFMFEGHDTTSSGIVFGLYCIAKHPEVQRKILEEQIEILGDDLERDPTYSDLQQMKYLESVIKESLRLYPPVPLIQRRMTHNLEMSGMRLLKDSMVLINIFRIHRHPDVYENPLEFHPDRFQNSHNTKSPFAWIPFSAGPRNCIGQKFAMMELKITLAAIVRRFKILPGGTEPQPCGDLILRSKNGVYVKMLPRK